MIAEAFRSPRPRGLFANYSLNVQAPIRWIKRVLDKDYHIVGWVEGSCWLARASQAQKRQIETTFSSKVTERWSEILYSPEPHFPSPGKIDSWLCKFDALLSNNVGFFGWLARQHSFHCRKS
jgi:hypothetical protein